jgi:hypothetical protein
MVQTSNSFELLHGTDSDHDQEQPDESTKTAKMTKPNTTELQYSPTRNKEDPESTKN